MKDNYYAYILDDSKDFILNIEALLEFNDIKCKTFLESNALLDSVSYENLKDECFFLVIDYSLPDLDGVETLEKLFKKTNDIFLPFHTVMYTGNKSQISNDRLEFLSSKKIEILEKPQLEKLLEKINYTKKELPLGTVNESS